MRALSRRIPDANTACCVPVRRAVALMPTGCFRRATEAGKEGQRHFGPKRFPLSLTLCVADLLLKIRQLQSWA